MTRMYCQLFKQMIAELVHVDYVTMASVISIYAKSANLVKAKNLHYCLLIHGCIGNT